MNKGIPHETIAYKDHTKYEFETEPPTFVTKRQVALVRRAVKKYGPEEVGIIYESDADPDDGHACDKLEAFTGSNKYMYECDWCDLVSVDVRQCILATLKIMIVKTQRRSINREKKTTLLVENTKVIQDYSAKDSARI